jgi:hypothetical protein
LSSKWNGQFICTGNIAGAALARLYHREFALAGEVFHGLRAST